MKCPNGHEVGDNVKYCPTCGAEIISGNKFCTKCGNERKGAEKFCPKCGTPFDNVINDEIVTYEEEQPKSGFKKYLPYIIGGILLLGIVGYFNSKNCEEVNDNQSVVADSIVVEDTEKNSEEEIQAKKNFIETFYKGMENSNDYDVFVRKHVTSKALKILKDKYDYECDDGDCLAIWLFSYEAGSDIGAMVSRTINMKDENNFLVVTKYEDAEYEVRLSVVKDGDSYKIDDIEKVRADYKAVVVNNSNYSSDESYSSSNTSSSSRTFYSEQIVIGYLANQSFRESSGLTMRVDGDGRLYVDGDYAGVLSVLRYNSTSALLRFGGGVYGEGKLTVNIVGDKFILTDPTDGTVYYQK
jgi:hypothetical protein